MDTLSKIRGKYVLCTFAICLHIVLCLPAAATAGSPEGQMRPVRIGKLENGALTLDVRLSVVKNALEQILGEKTTLDGVTLFKTGGVSYLKASGMLGKEHVMIAVALTSEGPELLLRTDALAHLCTSTCASCEYVLDIELHISGCTCGSTAAVKRGMSCTHTVRPDIAAKLATMLQSGSI